MTALQTRQPAGAPTGGRFAGTQTPTGTNLERAARVAAALIAFHRTEETP